MEQIFKKKPYQWYAVYTKSRAEKKVYAELERKGIESYLPLKPERRQWSDRVKVIEEPLIRGYVFVRVSNKEYYDVLVIPGALRYVCFEERPAVIPDCQIADLKIFMEYVGADLEVTSERIRKGDRVRVVTGPLKNVRGEVVEVRGKRRILLRFDSLGYCIHVELGANTVEQENGNSQVPICYGGNN